MPLVRPAQITLNGDVLEMLHEVSEEAERFRELGKFPPEVREEIARSFLPERISDTLNIEGIRVNPRVTRAVLEGQSLAESDRYNEREILNVIEANGLIEELSEAKEPLSAAVVRELHKRVARDLIREPGAFRTEDVRITGAELVPPHWAEVPIRLEELCTTFEESVIGEGGAHWLLCACWVHASFTAIHPFRDGNGRVGRLLQDYVLLRASLLPVGIPAARRQEYYEALAQADQDDWSSLAAIVADAELKALDRSRRIAEAPTQRREKIRTLLRRPQAAARQREYNLYELWRRRFESIRDEFQRWAGELNQEGDLLQTRVKVWDPISFEKWLEIRDQGSTAGTWLFTLTFLVERRTRYSFIFFARRHEFNVCLDSGEGLYRAIGMFVTGHEPEERPHFYPFFKDAYVRLRELVYNEQGEFMVFRDPVAMDTRLEEVPEKVALHLENEERWIPESQPSLPDVVEEFLSDVIVKLGLSE